MKYVVVFDMDDTLYEELTFVKSGFIAVAEFLNDEFKIDIKESYNFMCDRLYQDGRGSIFNSLLEYYGIYTLDLVQKCVDVYRYHQPRIKLQGEVIDLLNSLKNYPLYVVTDGFVPTQEKKIQALGLPNFMKKSIASYSLGSDKGKPSPYWFKQIVNWEKVEPKHVVYIGDNAKKDFIGIKPLGFHTIRVKTGEYKEQVPSELHEAEYVIECIRKLPDVLKKIWSDFRIEGELI
ncbi:hypothetical protein EP18_18995 [Lysinibacillus sphaericus]|nr:HAD family hydrolase [Lysinibacillus sphaericus]KEK10104.1 hypothetical protein EP18_18995 [Lysinibacillus sphaericus]